MPFSRLTSIHLLICAAIAAPAAASSAQEPMLAKGGQAEAAIVIAPDASEFARWLAGELAGHLQKLSGAELPIVTANKLPAGKPLVVLGGPQSNPLAAAAEEKQRVKFADLKPDGFVLKRIELDGVPMLLAGGNDEAATMYAAYELLERLGIVFQLTNDIIPQRKPDLSMPALDARIEPALQHRGMHCCHGIRFYMGLEDFRREIDQLAKLKMNVLQFYWGMGGPWVEFSYDGQKAEILYPKESGYCSWAWPSSGWTATNVTVGRECFPQDGYLGPPEFAHVQTQEEAYATAREFLREIIRYAHSRKVQVWLAMGEVPFVPPNLIPPAAKTFKPFYCGIAIPHGEPAMLDIWEAAVRSMIETYPEADRYWVVSGSEIHIAADDPQTQAMIREYGRVRELLPKQLDQVADSVAADIAAADILMRRIKSRYPAAKLGVELIFRGGQLRAFDAVLPKDVWLMNMVNWESGSAISDFDKIHGRELIVWPRITDDGCELNIQLNAMMYDQEETIAGSVRYGLSGVIGQLNKARGAEQSAQFIAEGAWNPSIRCQSFYERYLHRLYGPDAQQMLLKAFLLLEENEKALGWHGRRSIFHTYARSCPMGVGLRGIDYEQEKPQLDRAGLEQAISTADAVQTFWDGRAVHCSQALELLRQAHPKTPPGSREELDYVIYKTENFVTVCRELAAVQEAKAAFDRAALAMNAGEAAEVRKHLEHTQAALDRANRLVRQAAEQMIPYASIPTERHILWILNKAIPSHQAAGAYLADVIAARNEHGQAKKP